jgi:hypothetical protein
MYGYSDLIADLCSVGGSPVAKHKNKKRIINTDVVNCQTFSLLFLAFSCGSGQAVLILWGQVDSLKVEG